ncbi:hypothetical protein [Streptomyces niveus]|uniref:Uncharacterized protein n=1 Tax=Streptomyces niveus TaxID=193462 RepID=A0ABZ2A7S3_STRNV|nr:hypothetical protein [Streptomyces niveus]
MDFEIHEQPQPPGTARELVDQLGVEAARAFLPPAEQRAFDQANPYSRIERANDRLADAADELTNFDADVAQAITDRGYNAQQAQLVYQTTAPDRQQLAVALQTAQQTATNRLASYENNLVGHIRDNGLTQTVAARSGQYSTSMSTAGAASLSPGNSRGGGRDQGGSGSSRRNPLGQSSGNRQRGRRS